MPKNDYTSYFFLSNKHYQITIPLTTSICLILLVMIEHLGGQQDFSFHGWLVHNIRVYLQIIPVMLLTSLSGYAVGSLVVLLFFIIETITAHMFPYHTFILLLSSLIANIPIFHNWYKKIWTTVLAHFIFSIFLGNVWHILFAILEDRDILLQAELFHFTLAAVPSFVVCAFCFLYYNCFPEKIKNLFFASVYESEELRLLKSVLARKKGRQIRQKLSNLIILEALVLLVAGFAFANTLLDQFRNVTSWQQVVFATRLIVLMMIVATPLILFVC